MAVRALVVASRRIALAIFDEAIFMVIAAGLTISLLDLLSWAGHRAVWGGNCLTNALHDANAFLADDVYIQY